MIIFADQNLASYVSSNTKSVIMNLFSNIIIGDAVISVTPTSEIAFLYYLSTDMYPISEEEKLHNRIRFRTEYLKYLCEYDQFMGIMDIIIADYYTDDNVIILSNLNDEMVSNIIECISQFIYDRWHYSTDIVFDKEDLSNITISEVDKDFLGIYNADIAFYMNNRKEDNNVYY